MIFLTDHQIVTICGGNPDHFDGHRRETWDDMVLMLNHPTDEPLEATLGDLRAVWSKNQPSKLFRLINGQWVEEVIVHPLSATPNDIAARHAICRLCSSYDGKKCLVTGCACSGAGFITRSFSLCPIGKWGTTMPMSKPRIPIQK